MAKIKSEIPQVQLQNASCNEQQTLEQVAPSENRVVERIELPHLSWPTSKPGPQSTPPPAGMHSINVFRPEQVAEIAYSEPTGDSLEHSMLDATPHGPIRIDQPRNAQEALGKRKLRL